MIELKDVRVTTPETGVQIIYWEVKSTDEDLTQYYIDMYALEAPTNIDEFELVASGIEVLDGSYTFSGMERMDMSTNRQIYYYLRTKKFGTNNRNDYGPYTMLAQPDLQALEIIRRKNIILTNPRYNARTFYLLKIRTWGNFCSRCIDSITQKPQDDHCPVCYGTGIEGGYHTPLSIQGFRSDKPKQLQINLFGSWEDGDVFFNLQNNPYINPGDFIVDEFNERYIIQSPVKHIEKGLYIIDQMIRAKTISRDHPVYDYDLTSLLGG